MFETQTGQGWGSGAEILERARAKVRGHEYVFGPQVTAGIELLRKAKRRQAAANPELEYRIVIDLDLLNAITTGVAVETTPPNDRAMLVDNN